MNTQHYECTSCGWTGHEDELRSEQTFAGNQEEPPEFEAYCPSCGDNWDQMDEVASPEEQAEYIADYIAEEQERRNEINAETYQNAVEAFTAGAR